MTSSTASSSAPSPSVPERGPRAGRRVPRPLAALLAATLVLCAAWTVVTPALQAPDENSHFGYVQSLGERGALPGDAKRQVFSTEQFDAANDSNADQAAAQPATKMEWSRSRYDRWRAREAKLPAHARADGGGPNPASSNPPLYYLYETPAYLVAKAGDFFTRLQLLRLASMLWMLVTVSAVWLLAGETFGRDRLLQLAAAGAVALAPVVQFVSATVTPDAMLYAIWSLAVWLGVRVLKRGLTPARAFAFMAAVGTGCAVKATAYALLPGALLVLAVGLRRARPVRRAAPAVLGAAGAGLLATAGVWFLVARLSGRAAAAQVTDAASGTHVFNLREAASYLWQFYLPRLPFQNDFPSVATTIPVYDIWLKGAWASFGWLEVQFSDAVYLVLAAITIAVVALAVISLWRHRATSDWAVGAFLVLVAVTLVAALHWSDYKIISAGGSNFAQGRYLLPLAGMAGLALAQALRPLGPRGRAVGVTLALGGLFALDLASLGLTLERFYA